MQTRDFVLMKLEESLQKDLDCVHTMPAQFENGENVTV